MSASHQPFSARDWIEKLDLSPHPEGGYYKEVYRSGTLLNIEGYPSPKSALTSIYFLLENDSFSAFHRLKSPEVWYFHAGNPVEACIINPNGELVWRRLGATPDAQLQIAFRPHHYFAAEVSGRKGYSLVSCAVGPGFDFDDFEMPARDALLREYPQHEGVINRFTRL